MSIIRTPRKDRYAVISSAVFESGLSFRAIGLLTFLLSKPDHWKVYVPALVNASKDSAAPIGRDAVYATLGELMDKGFIRRVAQRNRGKFCEYDYLVYDDPQESPLPAETETVSPLTALPDTAEPLPADPTQVNTDNRVNTDMEINTSAAGAPDASAPAGSSSKSRKPKFGLSEMLADNPHQIPEALLTDWITSRNAKRATITPTAWRQLNCELSKCVQAGISAHHAATEMVARGWRSLKAEWLVKDQGVPAIGRTVLSVAERVALANADLLIDDSDPFVIDVDASNDRS